MENFINFDFISEKLKQNCGSKFVFIVSQLFELIKNIFQLMDFPFNKLFVIHYKSESMLFILTADDKNG